MVLIVIGGLVVYLCRLNGLPPLESWALGMGTSVVLFRFLEQ